MAASQVQTLRIFTALRLLRPSWAGCLLLGIGLPDGGRSLALAALAAGAASLFLEDDAATLREAGREGCTTFTVTTLEEALRALKNEVRQGRALTVALSGNSAKHLAEMVERGVLPQDMASARLPGVADLPSMAVLAGWGAQRLAGFGLFAEAGVAEAGVADLEARLSVSVEHDWQVIAENSATLAQRKEADQEARAAYAGDDLVNASMRLWLRTAPSLFPRERSRAVWVPR